MLHVLSTSCRQHVYRHAGNPVFVHVQVAMVLWTYFAAVVVDPGRVPPGWHPFPDDSVRSRGGGALQQHR